MKIFLIKLLVRYFLFLLIITSFWSACKSTQPATTEIYTDCFKAVDGADTYVLLFFKDSSFIWCKNLGEQVSWGRYRKTATDWALASFVQSTEEVPLVVWERYDSTVQGTRVEVRGWSNVTFIGAWTGFSASNITIDGVSCAQWSGAAIPADSMQVAYSTTRVTKTVGLKANGLPEISYLLVDPKTNVLEWYYLRFARNTFQVFDPIEARLDKRTHTFPKFLLRGKGNQEGTLKFKKVTTIGPNVSLQTSPAGTALAAYYAFRAVGRHRLLNEGMTQREK